MATLINGDGNAAVYAAQDADYYAGVEGDVTKILPVGLKMAYEIEDANTIAIKNGVIITKEGRRIQLDAGSIDEFTIPTGSQGITKYYIIGYHLYTDASSNQLCETFVQLMTSESETITENTFRGGSDEVYVSVYRVTQEGLALTTIESLLPEGIAIGNLDGIIGDTDISDIGDGTLTGAIDTINSDLTEQTIYHQNNIRITKSANVINIQITNATCAADGRLGPTGVLADYLPSESIIGGANPIMAIDLSARYGNNLQGMLQVYNTGTIYMRAAGGGAITTAQIYCTSNLTYICA